MKSIIPSSKAGVVRAMVIALALGSAVSGWLNAERSVRDAERDIQALRDRNTSLIIVAGMVSSAWRHEQQVAGKYDGKADALQREQTETSKRLADLERKTRMQQTELIEMRKQQDFRESKGWTGHLEAH